MVVFTQDSPLTQTTCWVWKKMAANFPSLDCLQVSKLRNKKMKKEITVIVFEKWVENTPIQMIEEAGENEASFQQRF
jgi:hypothetical protein